MTESAERSATAKLRGMASRAEPLIEWYKANKPSVDVVRFTDEEYETMKRFPSVAQSYGFQLTSGGFIFKGFRCLPTITRTSTSSEGTAK